MFCPKCGTPSKGKRFCTRCGLEQRLPRYQGTPITVTVPVGVTELPVAPKQAATCKVAPAVITTPQRNAAAAQTVPFYKIDGATAVAPMALPTDARGTVTHKIADKPAKPRRKVSLLLVAAVLLLMLGGAGFQQYQHQSAVAQVVASPMVERARAPQPTPTLLLNQRWTIVADQTQQVRAAENALTEPDQQAAIIEPGGQLALELRAGSFFGDGPGADVKLHSTTPAPVSYTVFVRDDATAVWQRIDINRTGFPQGFKNHDMGHHGIQQARQLLIRNEAKTDLMLDAICALYPDQVFSTPSHPHVH